MQYPSIELEQFNIALKIIDNAANDPDYLDPKTCPYDEEVRAKVAKIIGLSQIRGATVVEKEKNPVGRPSKQVVLPISEVEKEVDEIRKEIAQLKIDAKGLETQDRIAIIKTRAALVEKIIAMKERITNMKEQRKFITDVMSILEDVMDQKQREEVIKQLAEYVND